MSCPYNQNLECFCAVQLWWPHQALKVYLLFTQTWVILDLDNWINWFWLWVRSHCCMHVLKACNDDGSSHAVRHLFFQKIIIAFLEKWFWLTVKGFCLSDIQIYLCSSRRFHVFLIYTFRLLKNQNNIIYVHEWAL